MAQRMADKFASLGGELVLNTAVQKVVIENGRVTGVLARGEHHLADAVIIASDAMSAVDSLFDIPPQRLVDPLLKTAPGGSKPQKDILVECDARFDPSWPVRLRLEERHSRQRRVSPEDRVMAV